MNLSALYFTAAVVVFLICLGGISWFYYRRSRKTARSDWEQLLSRLKMVDRMKIEQVALDAIDASGKPRKDDRAKELSPEQIWDLTGGLEGLEALEANSRVLVEMASFVQRWFPDASKTADELRLIAREIEWHVGRLRAAADSGKLEGWFANYAQNAAAAYYVMTRRLLVLFETKRVSLLADVQKAL